LRPISLPIGQFVARGQDLVHRLGQRMPWYVPTRTIENRNIRNLYTETTWFGVLNGLTATFMSVFALRLGATTDQVGWLTALPALVSVVWLIPAARLIERQQRRLPLILWAGFLQRLGYLLLAIMPFFIVTGRVEALIIINTLVTLPAAIINTAITALIPDLTTAERRGQLVSMRWLLLSLTATAAALLGGKLLDLMPVPLNYQVLIGGGTLLSLIGLFYLRRIKVPRSVAPRPAPQPGQRISWQRLQDGLVGLFAQREFMRFTLASFVFYWGIYLPAALWSILRVRELGASDTWIGLIAVVVDGSTILGYFFWGKIVANRGNRWVLIVTAVGVSIYAFLTALVPTIGWMIPTSVLGGFTWAGCNLALFNMLLHVCPAARRPTYVALYTALMNVSAFAAPMLGAALSDWAGIRIAFIISAGVRGLGILFFLWLVRQEPDRIRAS
jgi:MFS family permease